PLCDILKKTALNLKYVNFYSNKQTSFVLLILSSLLVTGGFIARNSILNFEDNMFKSIVMILALMLFAFGVVLSLLLLFRKKPLLTITDERIIIYNIFTKPNIVEINNIKSFFIVNTIQRGITTNRQIYIELIMPTEKFRNSLYYKLINKINKPFANSQHAIQTNFLNIKQKDLLKILEKKLKNVA
ncbi:STM3941 family protein, partial [Chryseobacterium koreense]